jgi:Dienelactone hydrolase family
MKRFLPVCEQIETRLLQTLVFVFNGNAFSASKPDTEQTGLAAQQLILHGDRAIQLSTPEMDSPRAFYHLAAEIRTLSQGRPIGLMGFSAGGALAMRLAGVADLHVQAVMSFYGVPDLRDWLNEHRGDRYYEYVTSRVHFDSGIINLLSGPSPASADIVSAFGLDDHNVVSSLSTQSFDRDFPHGQVFYYPGPHGVTLNADLPAFDTFLADLSNASPTL